MYKENCEKAQNEETRQALELGMEKSVRLLDTVAKIFKK
jgi:hypothetical protein